jgi:hypothetical protein
VTSPCLSSTDSDEEPVGTTCRTRSPSPEQESPLSQRNYTGDTTNTIVTPANTRSNNNNHNKNDTDTSLNNNNENKVICELAYTTCVLDPTQPPNEKKGEANTTAETKELSLRIVVTKPEEDPSNGDKQQENVKENEVQHKVKQDKVEEEDDEEAEDEEDEEEDDNEYDEEDYEEETKKDSCGAISFDFDLQEIKEKVRICLFLLCLFSVFIHPSFQLFSFQYPPLYFGNIRRNLSMASPTAFHVKPSSIAFNPSYLKDPLESFVNRQVVGKFMAPDELKAHQIALCEGKNPFVIPVSFSPLFALMLF